MAVEKKIKKIQNKFRQNSDNVFSELSLDEDR